MLKQHFLNWPNFCSISIFNLNSEFDDSSVSSNEIITKNQTAWLLKKQQFYPLHIAGASFS